MPRSIAHDPASKKQVDQKSPSPPAFGRLGSVETGVALDLNPAASTLVVAALSLQTVALLSNSSVVSLVAIGGAVISMALGLIALGHRIERRRPSPTRTLALVFTVLGFFASGAQLAVNISGERGLQIGVVALWVASLVAFVFLRRRSPAHQVAVTLVLVLVYAVMAIGFLRSYTPHFDVMVVLTEGARGLLEGHNPYAITYSNVYTPSEVDRFYGPNFLVDGRVPYGYPYPPVALFLSMPGYLLGDVRVSGVVSTALALVAMVWFGRRPARRLVAALLVAGPGSVFVIQGWTEMLIVPLIVGVVLCVEHRKLTVAAVLLAMVFVSKQYFAVALPALWLLRPYATTKRVLTFVGTAALLVIPWVVANPGAMYRALVGFQSAPPLRLDSLSITVWIAQATGTADSTLFRVLPLAAGLVAVAIMAVMARPGLSTFLVAVALAVFTTVIFSKQGFFNYYYLVAQLLVLAAYVRSRPARENFSKQDRAGRLAPESL